MKGNPLTDKDFEALFLEYFRPLCVFAVQFVKDQGTAEDIVHDLFLKLYEKRASHTHQTLNGNYLYRSVHNRCLNRLDHLKVVHEKQIEIKVTMNPKSSDPFEIVSYIEFEHKLLKALEQLPPKCRLIFEMSRLEGKRNEEIAGDLKLSKRTVETHISQALKIMRKKLIKYLPLLMISLCNGVLFIYVHFQIELLSLCKSILDCNS